MLIVFSVLLGLVFILLSSLHFYWAAGGRWSADDAAPTNAKGVKLLNTGPIPSIIVGVGLLLFALHYLLPFTSIEFIHQSIHHIIGWIIPAIFLLRAIGDFRYVGLTKKLKITPFAMQDTRYYTPLCLVIAALGFAVAFFW